MVTNLIEIVKQKQTRFCLQWWLLTIDIKKSVTRKELEWDKLKKKIKETTYGSLINYSLLSKFRV